MFSLTSFGKDCLNCISGRSSPQRLRVALRAARSRFPGSKLQHRVSVFDSLVVWELVEPQYGCVVLSFRPI